MEENFPPGAMIWVKIFQYPWWPAIVTTEDDPQMTDPVREIKKKNTVLVKFFGENNFAWMEPKGTCIQPFRAKYKSYSKIKSKGLQAAIEDAIDYEKEHGADKLPNVTIPVPEKKKREKRKSIEEKEEEEEEEEEEKKKSKKSKTKKTNEKESPKNNKNKDKKEKKQSSRKNEDEQDKEEGKKKEKDNNKNNKEKEEKKKDEEIKEKKGDEQVNDDEKKELAEGAEKVAKEELKDKEENNNNNKKKENKEEEKEKKEGEGEKKRKQKSRESSPSPTKKKQKSESSSSKKKSKKQKEAATVTDIKDIEKKLNNAIKNNSRSETQRALKQLKSYSVDMDCLTSTGIGKVVKKLSTDENEKTSKIATKIMSRFARTIEKSTKKQK